MHDLEQAVELALIGRRLFLSRDCLHEARGAADHDFALCAKLGRGEEGRKEVGGDMAFGSCPCSVGF